MPIKVKESVPTKIDIILLSKCKVLDAEANEVSLYDLWKHQTAVFIFLRHFGCILCRAHARQVWELKEKYQINGAKLYFIGNGAPHMINKFKEEMNIGEAPLYTDPTLLSFRAAGFKRGFLASVGPRAAVNNLKGLMNGTTPGEHSKANGNIWQLGGILVVKPDGKVAYQYISEVSGDFSPENDAENIAQATG